MPCHSTPCYSTINRDFKGAINNKRIRTDNVVKFIVKMSASFYRLSWKRDIIIQGVLPLRCWIASSYQWICCVNDQWKINKSTVSTNKKSKLSFKTGNDNIHYISKPSCNLENEQRPLKPLRESKTQQMLSWCRISKILLFNSIQENAKCVCSCRKHVNCLTWTCTVIVILKALCSWSSPYL